MTESDIYELYDCVSEKYGEFRVGFKNFICLGASEPTVHNAIRALGLGDVYGAMERRGISFKACWIGSEPSEIKPYIKGEKVGTVISKEDRTGRNPRKYAKNQ